MARPLLVGRVMTSHHSLTVALAFLLTGACVATNESIADDPEDDSFLGGGGKGDAAGIAEGSPEAGGVLRVANELGEEDVPEDLALGPRAADAIVAFRAGADGLVGTSDDRIIDTLTTLDAIPWVGTTAFSAMLTYARAHGYLAAAGPWESGYCGADLSMTKDQMLGLFAPGLSTAVLTNKFKWGVRSRTCNAQTGCSTWYDGGDTVYFQSGGLYAVNVGFYETGEDTTARLSLRTDASGAPVTDLAIETRRLNWSVNRYERTPDVVRASFTSIAPRTAVTNGDVSIGNVHDIRLGLPGSTPPDRLGGTWGAHCMRLVQHHSATDSAGVTVESEMVVYGRY